MMAGYRFNKEEYFKETKAVYSNYPTDVSRMEKELDRLLEKEQGFVIDLRSPWEYAAYHIPGAVNIPYERLKKVRGLPKNVPLIFYCERGSVSMVAAREMAEKGYRAKSLTGGIHSWHRRLG